MTVTLQLYGKLPANMGGGETAGETLKIDWEGSDTIKAALFTATYSPAIDTDELYSGLANEVANGNGYTTGGNACANATVTYTAAGNSTMFDADNPATWTASGAGFSFQYVVIYDSTTDVLVGYLNYGSTVTMSGANADTFTLTFDAAGVFTATVP